MKEYRLTNGPPVVQFLQLVHKIQKSAKELFGYCEHLSGEEKPKKKNFKKCNNNETNKKRNINDLSFVMF